MQYFFSRRAFDASKGQFTDNVATLTRYVALTPGGGGGGSGTTKSPEAWRAAAMSDAQANDVLIYVHGFNTRQSEFLSNLAKVEKAVATAGFQGAVVGFDWPSLGRLDSYTSDRTRMKAVARFLPLDGVATFLRGDATTRVHLLGHSMGAHLIARGFAELHDGSGQLNGAIKVSSIALVASDIDRDAMGKGAWAALVLDWRSVRLAHYYSTVDQVLDISHKIMNGAPRSGRDGIAGPATASFVDIACANRYAAAVPSHQQTTEASHNWYFNDAVFYRDLAHVLKGTAPGSVPTRKPGLGGDMILSA